MRKFYFAVVIFIIGWATAYSQTPGVEWEQCLLDGSFRASTKISDSKFAIAGTTITCDEPSKINLRLVKNTGIIEWTKEYNFSDDGDEYVFSVAGTPDGGYILSGYQSEGGISSYNIIIKTNNAGDTLWVKKIFIGDFTTPVSSKVITTSDGGYCFIGSVYGLNVWDLQLIKLDAAGNIKWTKTFGGTANDYGKSIVETSDKGFMLVGTTFSNDKDVAGNHGGSDIWVAKVGSLGGLQWQKCYGGTNSDEARSISPLSGDRFAIAGMSTSDDGDVLGHHGTGAYQDYWLLKISDDGSLLWNNSYGGANFDFASELVVTDDETLIAAGSSYSNNGNVNDHHGSTDFDDMWVIAIDSDHELIWSKSCGGTDYDHGNTICLLNDDQFVVAGNSLSHDGDHSGDCADSSCYPISGQWMIKLNSGCEQFPTAGFTFSLQSGFKYKFSNTSINATSYEWDFGDGTSSNTESPIHTFPGNGNFKVCLTATYNSCATSEDCQTISTCLALAPDFSFNYSGLDVAFSDQTDDAATWLWDFGDGEIDSVKNPTHTYSDHDQYSVKLTVWDSCGSSYITSKSVNTCKGMASDFSFTSSGNTIQFEDESVGEPNLWNWDFGDGTFSTLQNPSHTYTAVDTYEVCLTVDHNQCSLPKTKCHSVSYDCLTPVTSDFTYTPVDNVVSFDNHSDNAVSFYWEFGDGSTSNEKNPVHTYPPGQAKYDVCLTAGGSCGKDTTCDDVLVGKNPVIANFTYMALGLSVSFNNLSLNATSYFWDFGDGTSSTAQFPFHTYPDDGVYEVCLIAFDQFSLSDTFCQTLFLCDPFEGDWNYNSTALTVTFNDASPKSSQWLWDFGDGGTSILQDPTHSYLDNGAYDVCLITSNECGYSDTICKVVTVCAPLATDFSYEDTYLSVAFTDLTENSTGWLWSFGDGNSSTIANPVHNYMNPGTYNVCLSTVDLCFQLNSKCESVTVCDVLSSTYSYSAADLKVTFTDATDGAVQWKWSFGDGTYSSIQNPIHNYSANGTYEVCLIATDICENKDTLCQEITVCGPLVAGFNSSATYLTVNFSDVTPNASGWTWYFGDGGTSTLQNPVYTYSNPGTYEVCLIAADICNNTNIVCQFITICAPIDPDFSVSSFFLTASFEDQTGSAVQWLWDFGDGGNSTSQNPIHSYSTNGTYEVCLTATDECGNTDSVCQSITVCAPLSAAFSYSTTFLNAGFVSLTANATQWQWDFGDGGTSTLQNPSHTYTANGSYTVCLVVTNLCGEKDTTCKTISVCAPVDPDFSYTADNLTLSFTDQSAGAIQWFWDFGDGGISTSQNPSHNYTGSGNYEVCLIAYNLCTSDTVCKLIDVECPPFNADFSFEASNYTVAFTDESDISAQQWSWDFGDGTFSSIQNPVHVYTVEGEYTVCLIAWDDCSSDTTCHTVLVIISDVEELTDHVTSFAVYPNPLHEFGVVDFSLVHSSRIQFLLYDVQGRIVLPVTDSDFPSGKNQVYLNSSNLSSGVYLLRMVTSEGTLMRKIIIE